MFPPLPARAPTDPQPPPRLPPLLTQFAREEKEGAKDGPSAPPAVRSVSDPLPASNFPLPSSFPINGERPPLGGHRGSIDSVTSLPLLGMVRGVPVGNRVPLRVTNPGDRMSMSSSSGSIVDVKPKPLPRGSPLRGGVAFDVAPSPDPEGVNSRTHTLQLPGRPASDSSGTSNGSHSSRKSKNRREKTPRAEDGGEEKQEKILIVLLDEKNKNNKGQNKDISGDGATWHGLEHRLSISSTRKSSPPGSVYESPWLGPLVSLEEDVTWLHTPDHSEDYSDSEDDDDGSDLARHSTVVPVKNLLSMMGYLTPEAAVLGGTPGHSPYGSYAALPAPSYGSPYAATTAAALAYSSPYVSPQQASPYQLPISRPRTPVGYSPGGQPPPSLYASPGGGAGYPATAYASPAAMAMAMGYASPYASPAGPYVNASPGGGYASPYANANGSPAAGYASPYANASPGGGYENLAAAYSSPYVQPLPGAARSSSGFYYS
ncbi:hypothetical protein DFH06DRAFT_1166036 [Mycena polygramma]|nr:hypothetical protein DFH06DRAFT_1166036 [Mycena polygramma]